MKRKRKVKNVFGDIKNQKNIEKLSVPDPDGEKLNS